MRIFCITFFIFSVSLGIEAREDWAKRICGDGYTETKALSKWEKDKEKEKDLEEADERTGESTCIEVLCKNSTEEMKRKKCIKETSYENFVVIAYEDRISRENSAIYHGTGDDIIIGPGEPCYDDCTPQVEAGFFGRKKTVVGLKRESCMTCMMKLEKRKKEIFLSYAEIGKKIYQGQKCYNLCQDIKGKIQVKREVSIECQQCVGLNGLPGEKFDYLMTQVGECFEVDKNKSIRLVPDQVCKEASELIYTQFKTKPLTGLQNWLMGKKSKCVEVDEKTQGKIYDRAVDIDNCQEDPAVSDSGREQPIKESRTPSSPVKESGKSTKQ